MFSGTIILVEDVGQLLQWPVPLATRDPKTWACTFVIQSLIPIVLNFQPQIVHSRRYKYACV